ncbi:MAG: fluoride efflux transporter FluC, partial [Pyrinomonadaceae bacterium]
LILFTDKFPVSDNFRVAVIVGFLGAFTTFSTFEMEIYSLIRERFFAMALAYLLLSVVLGFIGLIAGIRLASRL